ncbi:MAG: hypothetical protein ACK4NC_02015 [Candidatus Gracilibacteria bacterium]
MIIPVMLLVTSCGNTVQKIDVKTPVSSGTTVQVENSNTNQGMQSQNNNTNAITVSDTGTIAPEDQSTEPPETLNTSSTKIVSCMNFYEQNRDEKALKTWKDLLDKFYPTFPGVMPGEVCTLNTGNILVTAALDGYYMPSNPEATITPPEKPYKKVILFDKNKRHLLSTTGLTCPNLGDTGIPTVDKEKSFKDNAIIINCSGGDAGHTFKQVIRVNTKDFSFGIIKEVHTGPAEGYITGEEKQDFIETTKELQPDGTWKVTEKKV